MYVNVNNMKEKIEIVDYLAPSLAEPIKLIFCLRDSFNSIALPTWSRAATTEKLNAGIPVMDHVKKVTRIGRHIIDDEFYDIINITSVSGNNTYWLGKWNDGVVL